MLRIALLVRRWLCLWIRLLILWTILFVIICFYFFLIVIITLLLIVILIQNLQFWINLFFNLWKFIVLLFLNYIVFSLHIYFLPFDWFFWIIINIFHFFILGYMIFTLILNFRSWCYLVCIWLWISIFYFLIYFYFFAVCWNDYIICLILRISYLLPLC